MEMNFMRWQYWNYMPEHWLAASILLFNSLSAVHASEVLNASLTLIEIQLFREHPIYNEMIGILSNRRNKRNQYLIQMNKNSSILSFSFEMKSVYSVSSTFHMEFCLSFYSFICEHSRSSWTIVCEWIIHS